MEATVTLRDPVPTKSGRHFHVEPRACNESVVTCAIRHVLHRGLQGSEPILQPSGRAGVIVDLRCCQQIADRAQDPQWIRSRLPVFEQSHPWSRLLTGFRGTGTTRRFIGENAPPVPSAPRSHFPSDRVAPGKMANGMLPSRRCDTAPRSQSSPARVAAGPRADRHRSSARNRSSGPGRVGAQNTRAIRANGKVTRVLQLAGGW